MCRSFKRLIPEEQYTECECDRWHPHDFEHTTNGRWYVIRDGRIISVCYNCHLSGDKEVYCEDDGEE